MTTGLVWGKFLPLHNGHLHLIDTALSQCDHLFVVLGARHDEPISRAVREAWLAELAPQATVLSHWDDAPIDYADPHVWDLHLAQLRTVLPQSVDVVFSSEEYGEELARRLDAKHVCVDQPRVTVPISGTAVRADLAGAWQHLPSSVRSTLCRRVVVLGAESTGTTTLATALAERLGASWVAEFGRQWSADRPGGLAAPWTTDEFDHIAERQSELEDRAARETPAPWLVCDTDVLATAVWHERYMGARSPSVETLAAQRVPDLYILTGDEIPFVQDGLRDGEHLRGWMQTRFREVLAEQPAPWTEVTGSVGARLTQATAALAQLPVWSRRAMSDPRGRLTQ